MRLLHAPGGFEGLMLGRSDSMAGGQRRERVLWRLREVDRVREACGLPSLAEGRRRRRARRQKVIRYLLTAAFGLAIGAYLYKAVWG